MSHCALMAILRLERFGGILKSRLQHTMFPVLFSPVKQGEPSGQLTSQGLSHTASNPRPPEVAGGQRQSLQGVLHGAVKFLT
jgi:hypothetical protein